MTIFLVHDVSDSIFVVICARSHHALQAGRPPFTNLRFQKHNSHVKALAGGMHFGRVTFQLAAIPVTLSLLFESVFRPL